MPALIMEQDFMMSASRVVPWHKLGVVVEEAPDSVAAIKLAKLDWEVHQKPVYINAGDSYNAAPNYIANVRSDTQEVLGIVSERYQIIQNQEAFSFTDALISGGDVRYETAGSLKNGRQVWMLAKINREYDILGDKVDPYLCFTMAHDGTGAIRALMTPIRVVCKNTLNMAIAQASRSWSTTHVGDIAAKMKEAERTLGLASAYMEKLNEEANLLTEIYVPDSKFIEILNEVLPIDEKVNERAMNTIMRKREAIQRAMKADDIAKFRGTGWQVINAVSDFVTHAEPARRTKTFEENRFAKVIGGDTLFDKTYQLLKAVA
jgi:phage/plasmid-like protein (TIGR03299 family)